jgi:hypothetical protein
MDLRERGRSNILRIQLAQDTDQWNALVDMVMSLRIP